MITKVLSYPIFSKAIFAVEHSAINGAMHIVGVEAKSKKGEFDIVQTFEASDITEVAGYFKKGTPISLVLTDAQVLHKMIHTTGTVTEVLSSAYPNLDLNNFYYEILQSTSGSFVAICRKSYVDEIITSYKNSGIQIIDFSLGNLQAAAVASYIEQQEFRTLTALANHVEGDIQTMSTNTDTDAIQYTFGDTQVAYQFVLPLALVFKKMGVATSIIGNLDTRVLPLQKEFKEKQFFKNALVGGIGLLLGILLINFFVFSSSYSKWQQLQEQQQIYATQKKQLEARIKKVKNKETIVNSVLNTGFSKSSWYTDQLIQLLPATVILETLSYQPIAKTPRKDKAIVVKNNQITISGQSAVKEDFTNWLQQLEQLDFVEKVMISNYGTSRGSTAAFEIQLALLTDDAEK